MSERIQGQGGAKQPPAAPTKEQIAAMMPKAAALLKELWRLECNGADLDVPVATALAAEVAPLADALEAMLRVVSALMPGVKYIAVKDYAELNEAPIAARAALRKAGREP